MRTDDRPHIFKPISIQAMWSALMSLNKACETARRYNYSIGNQTHQWVEHYISKVGTRCPLSYSVGTTLCRTK